MRLAIAFRDAPGNNSGETATRCESIAIQAACAQDLEVLTEFARALSGRGGAAVKLRTMLHAFVKAGGEIDAETTS